MEFKRNLIKCESPRWLTPHQKDYVIMKCCFQESCDELNTFVASSKDCEPHGVDIYERAVKGEFGQIAPYQPKSDQILASNARQKRNEILSKTDYTQLQDIDQTIKTAYAKYRQDIRNIPQQKGFPRNIIWPDEPKIKGGGYK